MPRHFLQPVTVSSHPTKILIEKFLDSSTVLFWPSGNTLLISIFRHQINFYLLSIIKGNMRQNYSPMITNDGI